MTKDRLGDLIKARDGKKGNVQVEIEEKRKKEANLKQTFERAEVLRQWIESIEENVAAIKQYFSKIDDIKTDQKELHDKIESIFQNNTSISHKVQSKLKEFKEELKNVDTSPAKGNIKNIQYDTLKIRYQKIFRQNTSELEYFRNIKKSQLEAQLRAKGVRVTDEELVRLLEEKADIQVFTENILAETAEAKQVLQDLEGRHQQLLKIERMLEDVRDLFLQMAILIDDQQEVVNSVYYQVVNTLDFVGPGTEDLNKTEKKRRRYIKRKIILIIVIVVLLAIILTLIFK